MTEAENNAATEFSHAEWNAANLDKFNNADKSRGESERVRNRAMLLINETTGKTNRNQDDINFMLRERQRLVQSWRCELQEELNSNVRETACLEEKLRQLEHALKQTERPLRVATDCLQYRSSRQGIDLVKDEVEMALDAEVACIRDYQEKMREAVDLASSQIDSNKRKQSQLQEDLDNKDKALNIDTECLGLKNTSKNINLQAGVEQIEASGSEPESWRKHSLKNREESHATRGTSAQVRNDIENLLNTACSDLVAHWNRTNQAFKQRINECQDAHTQLTGKLNMIQKEIREQDTFIKKIKQAILGKGGPMKVSQTRLEKRSHRPDVESCNDAPHIGLVSEINAIQQNVDELNEMLKSATDARVDLLNNKIVLERDIEIKTASLRIDKNKCMALRCTFPYQTKCDIASKNPVFYYVYYNIV